MRHPIWRETERKGRLRWTEKGRDWQVEITNWISTANYFETDFNVIGGVGQGRELSATTSLKYLLKRRNILSHSQLLFPPPLSLRHFSGGFSYSPPPFSLGLQVTCCHNNRQNCQQRKIVRAWVRRWSRIAGSKVGGMSCDRAVASKWAPAAQRNFR